MYDVIIVGARCAGSALALLLARSGFRVVLVDRTIFPSDTMSGHFIHPAGVSCLRRWGLFDRLAATDTPAQSLMTFDLGPVALTGPTTPAADGTASGYCPRRWLFDPLLAAAAVAAGAEFWDGVSIDGLLEEKGQVVGVRGTSRGGAAVVARAALIVGADGKRSRIAAAVAAEKYHHRPATTCNYYSYWQGFEIDHTHLFVRDGRFFVAAPTNAGLTYVGACWPIAEFNRIRADVDKAYDAALSEIDWIADRCLTANRVERVVGTADLDGYFRTAHGAGWALLGDAGYHRDPLTAQGMTDAFRHAELLAGCISDGLTGAKSMADALADYQRRRDATTLPMFQMTCDLARLQPPAPEMSALFSALPGNSAAIADFFGVMGGTVAVEDFFAPENIAAIMGTSAVQQRNERVLAS
jgi:flavin-dependent dehydrogenase